LLDFASPMESNLSTSRRDVVVNTLVGVLLVAVFLFPFLLFVVVAEYVLQALNLTIEHFFPGTVDPRVLIVGVSLLFSLVSGVTQARKKRWRNVFLSFAMIPVIASMWLADPHSPFGLQANFWAFGLLPMYAIGEGSDLTRSHFFLAASAICAAIAINTGLLGSGLVARIIAGCVLVGLALWFITDVRQCDTGPTNPGPKVPLSPTRA
jgi:hypothetical protein